MSVTQPTCLQVVSEFFGSRCQQPDTEQNSRTWRVRSKKRPAAGPQVGWVNPRLLLPTWEPRAFEKYFFSVWAINPCGRHIAAAWQCTGPTQFQVLMWDLPRYVCRSGVTTWLRRIPLLDFAWPRLNLDLGGRVLVSEGGAPLTRAGEPSCTEQESAHAYGRAPESERSSPWVCGAGSLGGEARCWI